MTKDYATILAQVIPVLALALGLEIRSISGKIKVNERGILQGGAIGALTAIQIGLGIAEFNALNVVGRLDDYEYETYLAIAIGAVFLSPSLRAAGRIRSALRGDIRD
jgi:hypothetical protein